MIRTLAIGALLAGCLTKPDPPDLGSRQAPFAVGENHACAIDSRAQLWCWGDNASGELGVTTIAGMLDVATPVQVGTDAGWLAVAAGNGFTCGIHDSSLRCWGDNTTSESLGGTSADDQMIPNFTPTRIYAGGTQACALDGDGRAMCWGGGNAVAALDPGGSGARLEQLAMNDDHTCALTIDRAAYCWGNNDVGQLGVATASTTIDVTAAQPRTGSYIFIAVGGTTTCGITPERALECWGDSETPLFAGQSGGMATSTGTVIDASHAWESITMAPFFACATTTAHEVFCWGYGDHGQLGDGFGQHDLVATPILKDAVVALAGDDFACARESDKISCWGQNRHGNLGNGQVARSIDPVLAIAAPGGVHFQDVVAGERHVCARTEMGATYCWGDNRLGQVDPDDLAETFITTPHVLADYTSNFISAGRDHTCAIGAAQDVRCWGSNQFQQLGSSAAVLDMTLPGPFGWVSAGAYASCGINNGAIVCWGHVPGQDDNLAPAVTIPKGTTGWTEVAVGDDHAIATDTVRTVGWGYACAATGSGSATDAHPPSDIIAPGAAQNVPGIPGGIIDLAVGINGGASSCALVDNGTTEQMICWGENHAHEITPADGCAPPTDRPDNYDGPDPGHPGGLIALAGAHGCTLTSNADPECWGDNDELELGVRPANKKPSDLVVVFNNLSLAKIAVGPSFACGIDANAFGVYCWGTSVYGELGIGFRFQDKPVMVPFAP